MTEAHMTEALRADWMKRASRFILLEGNEDALGILFNRGCAPHSLDQGMVNRVKEELRQSRMRRST